MSFGEVGETIETSTQGYASCAHGVGEFDRTVLLERAVQIASVEWATTSSGQFYLVDIDKALRQYPRNSDVLSQFNYYRSDIEITVRINSNQFFYGAFMVTMWPSQATGARLDERAVLDPTVISASCAESVIKTWNYSWPYAWKRLNGAAVDNSPTNVSFDVLAPLTASNANMPESVTIQLWARFKNIKLSYPTGPTSNRRVEAQSGVAPPKIRYLKKGNSKHPSEDSGKTSRSGNSAPSEPKESVQTSPIVEAAQTVQSLASFVTSNWGAIAGLLAFFDKPDRIECQDSMNIEGSIDLFNTDIPDTNVSVSVYKGRYVDPGLGRMPMTRNWTVSDYARIPGLRSAVTTFSAKGDSAQYRCISYNDNPAVMKIPLDFAYYQSQLWRGSIKVGLMFFTSTFISARFVVSYINSNETPDYPLDYSNGISRVINVKGDTIDTFTLPWLSSQWWTTGRDPQFQITVDSDVASVDTTVDPLIYLIVWIAGGDDIQFAFPRITNCIEWGDGTNPLVESQASPGAMFTQTFPPIVENTFYDIDNGYCTSENLGPITDLCKRYTPIPVGTQVLGFNSDDLDSFIPFYSDPLYPRNYAFRQTLFGSWRSAFLFRSGGYRWRFYGGSSPQQTWYLSTDNINTSDHYVTGTTYSTPHDGVVRLTVPQLSGYPFAVLSAPNSILDITTDTNFENDENHPVYLAARDDLQFGYPILPATFPQISSLKRSLKEKEIDPQWTVSPSNKKLRMVYYGPGDEEPTIRGKSSLRSGKNLN